MAFVLQGVLNDFFQSVLKEDDMKRLSQAIDQHRRSQSFAASPERVRFLVNMMRNSDSTVTLVFTIFKASVQQPCSTASVQQPYSPWNLPPESKVTSTPSQLGKRRRGRPRLTDSEKRLRRETRKSKNRGDTSTSSAILLGKPIRKPKGKRAKAKVEHGQESVSLTAGLDPDSDANNGVGENDVELLSAGKPHRPHVKFSIRC